MLCKKFSLPLIVLLHTLPAFSHYGPWFLPENDYLIDTSITDQGITENEFNDVIEKLQNLYGPIFKERKRTLQIVGKWDSPMVNARAHRKRFKRYVTLFGGMARHEAMTKKAFALIVCHELGHHLGGAPISAVGMWASSEGQADYFATSKCMRLYYQEYGIEKVEGELDNLPSVVFEKCSQQFKGHQEKEWCLYNAVAGEGIAHLFAIGRKVEKPSFETPDPKVTRMTDFSHPHPQCRLDTYFAGAICQVNHQIPLGTRDLAEGACHPDKGDKIGIRPRCWFAY